MSYFVPSAVVKQRPTTVMDLIDDSLVVNMEQLVALVTLKLVDSESPPTTYPPIKLLLINQVQLLPPLNFSIRNHATDIWYILSGTYKIYIFMHVNARLGMCRGIQ